MAWTLEPPEGQRKMAEVNDLAGVEEASLHNLPNVSASFLAVLWVLGLAGVAVSTPLLAAVSATVVLAMLIVSVATLRAVTLAVFAVLLVAAVALASAYGQPRLLWLGLERSTFFAAFLATLALLRASARGDPRLERYRDRLERVPVSVRPYWIVSGGFVLASVLSVGSSAVVSSAMREDAPEAERVAQARANVCGASLAIIWSPFFVAIAVVSDFMPLVPLPAIIGSGMLVGMAGLALAPVVYARGMPLRAGLAPIGALRDVALPVLAITAVVVALRSATTLSTIETMLIVLPVLCGTHLFQLGTTRLRRAAGEVWDSMTRMSQDVATVTAAMVLGTVLGGTPWMEDLALMQALSRVPTLLIVVVAITAMATLGFLGVQPLVAGTIWLIVLTGADVGLSELAIAVTVLSGWGMTAMLSLSSLNVRVTAAQHGVRPEQLVIGPNLLFFLAFVPVAVAFVMVLNLATRA